MKSMERDFWFNLNPGNTAAVSSEGVYIDLAQCASLVNRVSLRQGMEYVVESIELYTNGTAAVSIFRLPEHWPLLNAWEKAFHMWNNQQRDKAREAGLLSTAARYRDFKVFMNLEHADAGVASNLLPVGYVINGASPTDSYEWNISEFVIPNFGAPGVTVEGTGHMLGADDGAAPPTSWGLVHAYAETRARPHAQDPNIVDVDPDTTLFGSMQDISDDIDDIIENMQEHNHAPPYLNDNDSVYEFYPGGANQGEFQIHAIQVDGQLEGIINMNGAFNYSYGSIPGFIAPCGLLKVRYEASSLIPVTSPPEAGENFASLLLKVTLAPGGYKGLMAQTMQEAN